MSSSGWKNGEFGSLTTLK